MFSSTAAQPMRPYSLHERQHSDQSRPYGNPPRHMVELPRPLEPRPIHQLQSAHSEASHDARRADGFRQTGPMQSEYRPHTQNLPRLHDILTSGPSAQSPPTYVGSWSSAAGPPAHQQNADGRYSHSGWHPPMVEPPRGHESSYPASQGRRLELPVLETSPVTRHDSHVPQQSPYHGYHETPRDYDPRRERPQEPSSISYLPNGVPSPYTAAGADEQQYRSPAGSLDRSRNHPFPPNAPESSKKYIGVREVPGEGQFHLYEGGYRIPTSVDGENVNPAWGLTKANKPRKRLAMACLDCREKKIKCEPGASSCLQCEKAKRPCRKAPSHQSQSEAGTTPIWQSSAGSPVDKGFPDPANTHTRDVDLDLTGKRRTLDEASPSGGPAKKHRSASPLYAVNGNSLPGHNNASHHVSPVMPRSLAKVVCLEEDPFTVEPDMTAALLERYLTDVNDATYRMFPRHHLMHWLRAYPHKCQNERMVLYALLALGSTFADDQYSGFGKHCANIATNAVHSKSGRFNMAVVQTRLVLGLFHFAKGANTTAWEYIAAAVNAASYMRYQTEDGCTEEESAGAERRSEFALSKEQLIECKRRTWWSCFVVDRYCGATHTMINPQDIFIRLPCTDDAFERGFASNAPLYNNGIVDPSQAILTTSSAVSAMAWVILISAIWGDTVNFINRSVHRAPNSYEDQYEKFYENTHAALQGWHSRLPDHLQFSRSNAERSIQGGYAGAFVSMHVLYHLTFLKMNRFARHEYISKSIARNVRAAHRHALEILQVMSCLRAANEGLAKENHPTFSLTTSFAGCAILAAIDVVGAGGLDSNLTTTLDLIGCGLESLRELGRYWNSARDQHKACEKRFYQIHNVLKHPFTARSGCWLGRLWGVHSSLEVEFALKDDCIYGVSDRDYFDALKEETVKWRPNGTARIA